MNLFLCSKIAFVLIAGINATPARLTTEDPQLQNINKRNPQENAPSASGPVPTIPNNVRDFNCEFPTAAGKSNFPAQSFNDPLAKACSQMSNPVNGFPKEYIPLSTVGFSDSAGPFFLMPIDENSDLDTFIVINSRCSLAALVTQKLISTKLEVRAKEINDIKKRANIPFSNTKGVVTRFRQKPGPIKRLGPEASKRTRFPANRVAARGVAGGIANVDKNGCQNDPFKSTTPCESVRMESRSKLTPRDVETNDLEVCAATII